MAEQKSRATPEVDPAENGTDYNNPNELCLKSQEYLRAGLSVIPADPKTKKQTLKSWKAYQTAPMSQEGAQKLEWPGLAIITGKGSGHLEALDFDFKAAWFDQWAALVEAEAPGLVARLTREGTQSGGIHIAYRCPAATIPGNQKLAADRIEVGGAGEHEFQGKKHAAHQD